MILAIDLPMSPEMKRAIEKAQKKRAEQAERRKKKRDAKTAEEKSRQQEKRAEVGEPEPKCASCGREGHQRSSSKLCANYKPKNAIKMAADGLTRKSTIKSSLQRGCLNQILIGEIQKAVLKTRNLAHVGSLFANFAIIHRLQSGQPIPPLDQSYFYNIFGQLIGVGSNADQWVKNSYQDFCRLMPSTLPSTFYTFPEMVTRIAQEYHKNFANHITHNFERFCTNYFFLRLNNDADLWYVADVTVKERRSIASYLYKRVASLEPTWPDIDNDELLQSTFDERAHSIHLGPTPVSEANLFAKPHTYLPFLHTVLTYMENVVHILEPTPQNFVSKGYIYRKLQEVYYLIVATWMIWVLIIRLDFCWDFCSKQGIFKLTISCAYSYSRSRKCSIWPKNSA
jgi:hypothetical protein